METIVREKSVTNLLKTMAPYLPIKGFEPKEWIANPLNVALTDGIGNYSLYEREDRGVVSGHYFFVDRGRSALALAKRMLREIFTGPYDVQVIRGLTPVHHKGALWMNRKLGFTSYGVIETTVEPYQLVILTKKEWETLNEFDLRRV